MSKPTMELWTQPSDWFGTPWKDHYVFLGQNRDSDALSRSNFTCALESLGGESDTVHVVRERHWACGWIEWIAIHKDNAGAVEKANDMLAQIDSYPALNESHWSALEHAEFTEHILEEFNGNQDHLEAYMDQHDGDTDCIDWLLVEAIKKTGE